MWGAFGKKMYLILGAIQLVAICRIKLITSNDYSPTKNSPFCFLKLLTQTCESKSNWGIAPVRMR